MPQALSQEARTFPLTPQRHCTRRAGMHTITLKKKREKSVLRRHPWVFSGAIARCDGTPQSGDTVRVVSAGGDVLGYGAYSATSQITVRLWSWNADEPVSADWFRQRLQNAIAARQGMLDMRRATAYRVINAESDGLPGVVIDRYGDFLVGQFLSAGAECWKTALVEQIMALMPVKGFYERSDVDVRAKEGLPLVTGVLAGDAPPERIEIREGELRFLVDTRQGHKTGWYLDQRENRAALSECVENMEVLNCFAYTGAFGAYALKFGAAHVVNLDSSADALDLARQHVALNGFAPEQAEYAQADGFQQLRHYQSQGRRFDIIILDPPKFVNSRKHLERACRGYKDINLLAMRLLKPGGLLMTYSCSGLVSPELFQKIVADAALDAGRSGHLLRRLGQAADHPVALNFPEGAYLKGLLCRVYSR